MKNNKTNIRLLFSTITLIVIVSIFVLFLNIIKNKNQHTSVVLATLDKKIKDKENIGTLGKKMNELQDVNKKIGGFIVDTKSIDMFVEFLENIGTSNNTELIVNGVDIPKNTKNVISVRVNIIGSFTEVMKSIALIENSQYIITMVSSFINKNIEPKVEMVNTSNDNEELKEKIKDEWQADLTFNVLSI